MSELFSPSVWTVSKRGNHYIIPKVMFSPRTQLCEAWWWQHHTYFWGFFVCFSARTKAFIKVEKKHQSIVCKGILTVFVNNLARAEETWIQSVKQDVHRTYYVVHVEYFCIKWMGKSRYLHADRLLPKTTT